MNSFCTVQIFLNNTWQDCAIIELKENSSKGWQAKSGTYYNFDYALEYMMLRDGHAVSNHYPVNIESNLEPCWPAFLVDLLPQGYGRKELLKRLGYSEYAQEPADWDLLLSGASNSIGNLRIKEAHDWLLREYGTQPIRGFTLEEITNRSEDFIESLSSFGLFIAGSSGVQGEWPKLLLTQGLDNLYYLDHILPDDLAQQHWLVKFSRGTDVRLNKILSQEALYMQLAEYLQLRVYKKIELHNRTLFIPRFDREVQGNQVERIAQESLASFCGKAGFGVKMTHNEVCQAIQKYCSYPEKEILEYLKRDIANIALGNKDNHTRNTAFQRFNDGLIQLTPLFDFAPMWLHPDGIARCTKWQNEENNLVAIAQYILENTSVTKSQITAVFREQLSLYQGLLAKMKELRLDSEIIKNSEPKISQICNQLMSYCHG